MRPSNILGKKHSFRHVLKSSASMSESSGSQFVGTATKIQSRPHTFWGIKTFRNWTLRKKLPIDKRVD